MPKLFARWRQRCGRWLSVPRQLVVAAAAAGKLYGVVLCCRPAVTASGRHGPTRRRTPFTDRRSASTSAGLRRPGSSRRVRWSRGSGERRSEPDAPPPAAAAAALEMMTVGKQPCSGETAADSAPAAAAAAAARPDAAAARRQGGDGGGPCWPRRSADSVDPREPSI